MAWPTQLWSLLVNPKIRLLWLMLILMLVLLQIKLQVWWVLDWNARTHGGIVKRLLRGLLRCRKRAWRHCGLCHSAATATTTATIVTAAFRHHVAVDPRCSFSWLVLLLPLSGAISHPN